MMSIASLMFLIATVAAATTTVDYDNGNNKKISNGEQECYSDHHYKENMQTIIQRELGTNNSISDLDIAIKDGQVCVYTNDNLDERKSGISQLAPMRDENNTNTNNSYCNNPSTCVQFNLDEGDDKIGDINIDFS
jgi:hypothetical protein